MIELGLIVINYAQWLWFIVVYNGLVVDNDGYWLTVANGG